MPEDETVIKKHIGHWLLPAVPAIKYLLWLVPTNNALRIWYTYKNGRPQMRIFKKLKPIVAIEYRIVYAEP